MAHQDIAAHNATTRYFDPEPLCPPVASRAYQELIDLSNSVIPQSLRGLAGFALAVRVNQEGHRGEVVTPQVRHCIPASERTAILDKLGEGLQALMREGKVELSTC